MSASFMPKRPSARDVANAYNVLGTSPSATPAEVKSAHRDLVKVWHPDRFEHDARLRAQAATKLRAINAAYDVLVASFELGVEPSAARHPRGPESRARVLWPRLVALAFLLIASFAVTFHFVHSAWRAVVDTQRVRAAPPTVAPRDDDTPATSPAARATPGPTGPLDHALVIRAAPLLSLYPALLKNAAAHAGEKTCGTAFLFNAEEKVLQLWLTDKKRILYEKNVFASISFPADKCVQDLRVTLCGHVKGIRTYKTRQGETQSVPEVTISAITCAGTTYKEDP